MEWKEIKRDNDGFATEECLNEMFKNEMFMVRDKYDEYFLCLVSHWREEIKKYKIYTHYLPIPKVKL